jgi:hypothetical protein
MKISQQKTVHVYVTEMRLYIKVCDRFEGDLKDSMGDQVGCFEGYVPDFFPGEHFGDYLMLNINLETGLITNWKAPTAEQLEKLIGAEEAE